MEPVRGAGKRPTDGAPYIVKEGYWYCDLCWCYAWGDHMTSAKHLRRLADYFDEQEDLRQMHTIVGQAALPAPFKGPPPTPPESISSHAGSASGAAASAATPTVGPSTAAASAKMPPPTSPYVGPAEPWMPCMAAPPPPRLQIAQGSATISAAQAGCWIRLCKVPTDTRTGDWDCSFSDGRVGGSAHRDGRSPPRTYWVTPCRRARVSLHDCDCADDADDGAVEW